MALLDSFVGRVRDALELISPASVRVTEAERAEMTLADPWVMPEPDEKSWQLLSSGSKLSINREKSLVEGDRIIMRHKARRLCKFNPHARAILRNILKYTLGRGVKPVWGADIDNDPKKRQAMDRFWRDQQKAMKWRKRTRECASRLARDGEVVLLRFVDEFMVPDYKQKNEHLGKGPKMVAKKLLAPRFLDPELIRDSKNGSEDDGVVVDSEDAETLKTLKKVKANDFRQPDGEIAAEDVIFERLDTDMNEKRGVTLFASVIPFIEMYSEWIKDRAVLNRVRSSVALVRTFDASATQIKQQLNSEIDTERTQASYRGEVKPIANSFVNQKRLRPATVINARKGVDYKFISPNVQAADVHHDGRAFMLIMAAGTGLAEFMVSADSSNSNYASTLIAEGPAVKEFQDWQETLAEIFTHLFEWAVEIARENKSADIPDDYDPRTIRWAFPDMVARNRIHDVAANVNMLNIGAMSRRTVTERDGLDWEVEQSRLEAEREADAKLAAKYPPIDPKQAPQRTPQGTAQPNRASPGSMGGSYRTDDPNADPSPDADVGGTSG